MRYYPRTTGLKPKQWTWFTSNKKTIRCCLRDQPYVLISFIHWVDRAIKWLIAWQLPIKIRWRNAPLANPDFRWSNKHAPIIHPHVFNSFHRTILHRKSHRVFTCPSFSNSICPHFTIEPLLSVPYPYFYIRTLKKIEMLIRTLLSQETISGRHNGVLTR